jgi:uncharacterized protein (TIGR03066 family)
MFAQGLIFVALTATAPAQAPSPAEMLVGTWNFTRGNVRSSVTFDANGIMGNRIVTANGIRMRHGFYKLQGNTLSAILEEDRNVSNHTAIIKELTWDTLVIEDEDGTLVFKKIVNSMPYFPRRYR